MAHRPGTDLASADIAKEVLDTLLGDQLSRGESLNQAAGVLAGLAGVVTAFAATAPATSRTSGESGLVAAALAAVTAVVALILPRPGREPKHIRALVDSIMTADPTVSQTVLRRVNVAAAERNDQRLYRKGVVVLAGALCLAVGVTLLVAATID